jgi:hypothetical protein
VSLIVARHESILSPDKPKRLRQNISYGRRRDPRLAGNLANGRPSVISKDCRDSTVDCEIGGSATEIPGGHFRSVQLTVWMVLETGEHDIARRQTPQQDGYGFELVTDLGREDGRQDPRGSFSDWHS